jgi:hypothetical protein
VVEPGQRGRDFKTASSGVMATGSAGIPATSLPMHDLRFWYHPPITRQGDDVVRGGWSQK